MNEEQTDHEEWYTCATPGCGAPLEGVYRVGITQLKAAFPDHFDRILHILKGGTRLAYCQQCGSHTPYNPVVFVVVKRPDTYQAFVYIPDVYVKEAPMLLEQQRAGIAAAGAKIGRTVSVETFSDSQAFERRLGGAIVRETLPLLQSLATIDKNQFEEFVTWLDVHEHEINPFFFAGVALVIQKAIPFLAIAIPRAYADQVPTISADLHGAGRSVFQLFFFRDDLTIDPTAVQNMIVENTRSIIMLGAIRLAERLMRERSLANVESAVAEVFHPVAIDDEGIARIAGLLTNLDKKGELTPLTAYSLHAVLAALCHLSNCMNPCQDQWAAWYIAIELGRRDNPESEELKGRTVPLAFAQRTITVEQFADQISARLVESADDQVGIHKLAQFGHDVGAEDALDTWLQRGLSLDIEGVLSSEFLAENASHIAKILIEHGKIGHITASSKLHALAKHDPKSLVPCGRMIFDLLMEQGAADSAAYVICRISQNLNEYHLHSLANQELQRCREQLTARGYWPPSDERLVDLFTEEGNSLRYASDLEAALDRYDQCRHVLSADLSVKDTRTNERNRAIVLRDLGRVRESQAVLSALIQYTRTEEQANILHSLALCSISLGEDGRALRLSFDALEALPSGNIADRTRLRILTTIVQMAEKLDQVSRALDAAQQAFTIAMRINDSQDVLLMSILAARLAMRVSEEPDDAAASMAAMAVEMFETSWAQLGSLAPSFHVLALATQAASLYQDLGRYEEAEQLLVSLRQHFADSAGLEQWKLSSQLAQYALRRHDTASARSYLLEAQRLVLSSLVRIEAPGDPFAMVADLEPLQQALIEQSIASFQDGTLAVGQLRLTGDFQASLFSSLRLFRNAGQPIAAGQLDNLYSIYEDDILSQLASEMPNQQPLAILQTLLDRTSVRLLLTVITPNRVETRLLPWSHGADAVATFISRATFRLKMARPAQQDSPLERVPGWDAFAVPLRAAIMDQLPPGTHLCIIPGPLSGLPLQLIIGDQYPHNVVPSLAILMALRRRRRTLPGGLSGRPEGVHDFVVWRYGEQAAIIAAFQSASAHLARRLKQQHIAYSSTTASDGNREALFAALGKNPCVRLSCHGQALGRGLRFELLLAAEGRLPPKDAHALESQAGEAFRLNWESLAGLERCAAQVFSAACASGMAISLVGGERIGLERPLFHAGALTYVAPQWPVPVAHIQPLINDILIDYVTDPMATLAEIVWRRGQAARDAGVPEWVARSVMVHGEWL